MGDYRIDDLARAAGTTVRNVRVYQDRGLLPPPRRRGRVGIYGDAHLARLRLIAQLLERGYTFNHIAEFIAAWQHGRDLGDVLGLEEALAAPWSDEVPEYVTRDQLQHMFGGEVTAETLARVVEQGVLEPDGDGYRVPSPRLLYAGAELVAAGIPLSVVVELSAALASDVDVIARRLVEAVSAHITADVTGSAEELAGVAAIVRRLRPLAQIAVDANLARAMERHVKAAFGERLATITGDRIGGEQAS